MAEDPHAAAPWLSVIMPCYGGERWIGEALSSVAAGPTDGIEVLVIDGGPTTASRDLALRYADRLDLTVFDRPDLAQWHSKTNFGVEAARADHLCWLHVDDVWFPGRAAAVRTWIEAGPNVHLHLAPSAIIDRLGRTLGIWRCPLPATAALDSSQVTERLLVQNFIAAPAPVFRRDAWLACGGLDEGLWYTADWDVWLKLAASGPVRYHEQVTTGFRIHEDSLTVSGSRDIEDFTRQMNLVLARHLAGLRNGPKNLERAARASISVNAALVAASAGGFGRIFSAAAEILRLGPAGIHRYFRDSRIVDRLLPRLRARFSAALKA